MIKWYAILLFTVLSFSSQAQTGRLYFAKDYSQDGDPIEAVKMHSISAGGGNIIMLYKSIGQALNSGNLFFYIDKFKDGEFKVFDTKTISPNKYKDWVHYDYTFMDAGSYKVTIIDLENNELASEVITVTVHAPEGGYVATDKLNTKYYEEARISICKNIDQNGNAISPTEVVSLDGEPTKEMMVLVEHTQPLRTKQITIDIFKGDDYKEHVETLRYTLEEDWQWINFKYRFKEAGKYKFSVYNRNNVFVQSALIRVE